MVGKAIAISMLLMLGGCGFTSQGDAVRALFLEGVAKAADGGLKNAEEVICELAPIGAIKKRYTGDRAKAYNDFCDVSTAKEVIK